MMIRVKGTEKIINFALSNYYISRGAAAYFKGRRRR